ncbi:MAG: aminoacyl-tRNA hydrolase [Planctomycetales bacterium]
MADQSGKRELETGQLRLVVGLGNPGRKYAETRHNIGWAVLAELARKYGTSNPKDKFRGELIEANLDGQRVLLLAPHTFMNDSGQSVLEARDFYKIPQSKVLVVCDDFSLPVQKLRMRSSGSAGGQNGLDDVLRRLGTNQIARLRIGIGPVPNGWDAAAFVLGKFNKEEKKQIEETVWQAADAVAVWATSGLEDAMNRFN